MSKDGGYQEAHHPVSPTPKRQNDNSTNPYFHTDDKWTVKYPHPKEAEIFGQAVPERK